jgi:hypothetical protein
MGRLHTRLAEPFTDTFKGGVLVGYVAMISNVYAEMEEVIQDHPDCNESVPVDGSRMSYLLHRFAGTPYHDSIYDIHIQCQNQGSTFDEFAELIRNKYASADDSDFKASKRRARTAQTSDGSDEDNETLLIATLLASSNPLHVSDPLLKLMRKMNPDFTNEFLAERNKLLPPRPNTAPTPAAQLPKQYSNPSRQANVATAAGLTSIVEKPPVDTDGDITPIGYADDPADTIGKMALLARLMKARAKQRETDADSDSSDDEDDRTSRSNVTYTIRGDYERAVTAALAAQTKGQFQTVSDGGADTWILGKGWRVLSQTSRHANVVGFDSNYAKKKHLPIVVGAAVTTNDKNEEVILVVFEAVSNADSPVSLLGEYQTREAGNMVDSVSRHHLHVNGTPGTQSTMRLVRPLGDETLQETTIRLRSTKP